MTIFVVVGVAGLLLAIVSNWLYDLARNRGILPDNPSGKRLFVVAALTIPLVLVVAWSATIGNESEGGATGSNDPGRLATPDELREGGAAIELRELEPTRNIRRGTCEEISAVAAYDLPSIGYSTEIGLSLKVEGANPHQLRSFPAESGERLVQISALARIPQSVPVGSVVEVEVDIGSLDQLTGNTHEIASDSLELRVVNGGSESAAAEPGQDRSTCIRLAL